jgi:FkbM family methyltransferase
VLSTLLRPDDRVLELGAGLGFITVLCARICGSEAVVTVEANPHMLSTLEATFRCNGVWPKLISGVVSRTAAPREFFVNQNFWSSSTYDRGGQRLEVQSLPFAELVAAHRPSVIVMDIEGGEVELAGLPIDPSVRAIVLELHAAVTGNADAEAVRAWLVEQGFRATSDWGNRSVVVYQRPQPSA